MVTVVKELLTMSANQSAGSVNESAGDGLCPLTKHGTIAGRALNPVSRANEESLAPRRIYDLEYATAFHLKMSARPDPFLHLEGETAFRTGCQRVRR
jgi:hypothetical protein